MKNDSRLEAWVEQHRELLLISSVLPLGKAYSVVESFERRRNAPDPAEHGARVSRVASEVKQYADKRAREGAAAVGPLRTDRKPNASLNTRATDKSRASTVQMGDLRAILGVNRERGTVHVEPFATTGEVATYLDAQGLQLEATIEMEDATLGGLVLAIGMTTHSHVSGLVHDT
ncbi:MAG: FAD-binding protein, partial [Deltaproteobacteria bacterium]|nr:FAD-binding protein [Deltaproteobacteria bacterium]